MRNASYRTALPCLHAAISHNPAFLEGWIDLAECQAQSGDVGAALASIEAVLARDPEHVLARYSRAMYRGELPESTPAEVVERLYGNMAATFDENLVARLGYRIPALLAESLKPWLARFEAANARKPFVLDLGCGTGLFGLQIRSSASRLVGVDLSASMLEIAGDRSIYDQLLEIDLVTYLRTLTESADLITATDVLIYVGNLAALFEQVARCLTKGGAFAFSTETPDDLVQGLRLQPNGRYAHSIQYIEQLAASNGLCIVERIDAVIRTENTKAVDGFMFFIEKPLAAVT